MGRLRVAGTVVSAAIAAVMVVTPASAYGYYGGYGYRGFGYGGFGVGLGFGLGAGLLAGGYGGGFYPGGGYYPGPYYAPAPVIYAPPLFIAPPPAYAALAAVYSPPRPPVVRRPRPVHHVAAVPDRCPLPAALPTARTPLHDVPSPEAP